MTPRRPQRPIRAILVPNPLWWWAFGRLLAPHARHFEARRRRRAAARAVRRGHGVALDLRIQCHRLSDTALVITAPGRLVLFAQRSPWRGSSRLDVPDLRPAQTRTATSPHPLCAAPLLCAARLASSEELTTLLQSGHNVAEVDAQGWTAIHHLCSSAERNKLKALQILLRHDADVEARSASLLIGLHIAATQVGDLAFLSQLLLASRDTGARDSLGRTALHYVALGSTAADAGNPHVPSLRPQPSDARGEAHRLTNLRTLSVRVAPQTLTSRMCDNDRESPTC